MTRPWAIGELSATELSTNPESIEVAPVHEGAVALLAGRLDENAGRDEADVTRGAS
jgi:hypothetical protein